MVLDCRFGFIGPDAAGPAAGGSTGGRSDPGRTCCSQSRLGRRIRSISHGYGHAPLALITSIIGRIVFLLIQITSLLGGTTSIIGPIHMPPRRDHILPRLDHIMSSEGSHSSSV
jgi:hypothetical protein